MLLGSNGIKYCYSAFSPFIGAEQALTQQAGDDARNEQIYHQMAISLLVDALTRLAWYQAKFNLPIETAKGVTAAVVVDFYES